MVTKKYIPLAIFDDIDALIDARIPQTLPALFHHDFKQACTYLLAYQHKATTFRVYRRELERFCQWQWFFAQVPLHDIETTDLENYLSFCQMPPKHWIAPANVKRFIFKNGQHIQNPVWRPFVHRPPDNTGKPTPHRLSEKSLRDILGFLTGFFNHCLQTHYLTKNPVNLIKQKNRFYRSRQSEQVTRRLTALQWDFVLETAEALAQLEPNKHERTLFVISVLFGLYLRISELVPRTVNEIVRIPLMKDFYQDSEENWWFRTIGKGNKERDIAVSQSVLNALIRWREHLKCDTALPFHNDQQPLIPGRNPYKPIQSTRQIRRIVKTCFDVAISKMEAEGLADKAEQLRHATVHWLRHTGISEDVKHRPREHVRDDAGHSSSLITDKYIDINREERHHSAQNKVLSN